MVAKSLKLKVKAHPGVHALYYAQGCIQGGYGGQTPLSRIIIILLVGEAKRMARAIGINMY